MGRGRLNHFRSGLITVISSDENLSMTGRENLAPHLFLCNTSAARAMGE